MTATDTFSAPSAPWMLTVQGHAVDLDAPLAARSALSIRTLAHALSCINRYTGHALRPISVAEHSLLVCEIIERDFRLGAHAQLGGLMHDAHEAITNDLSSPAKTLLGEAWHQFEGGWEHALHTAYALRGVFATYGAVIKRADLIAMATERRDLMPAGGPEWRSLHGVDPLPWVNLRDRDRMTWADWRQAFEDRFADLEFARTDLLQHPSTRSPL